jgi:hypothetical protein
MIASGATSGLCQDNSPLTPDEGRRVLGQLYELQSLRQESEAYRDYVERDREQDARERELSGKALELAGRETDLAKREADIQRDRAETYEALYRAVSKRPGWGCRLARVFTLGFVRCR